MVSPSAVTPDFETQFPDDSLWTEVGTIFYVSGNAMHNGGAGNNLNKQMYLSSGLGFTLSNTTWSIRYTYKCTQSGSGVESGVPLFVSDVVTPPLASGIDMIGVIQGNSFPLQTVYNNGATNVTGVQSNVITSGTTYYIQLQRTLSTSITLTIYEDPDFDDVFQSLTQTIGAVSGLNQLTISSTDNGGSAAPQSIWQVSDLKVYNDYNF